jgi:hypothetical protein
VAIVLNQIIKHRHFWLEVLGFFMLAIVLTWPMVLQPGQAALGSLHADGMKHLWTLWWMRASLWEYGDFPFQTDLVNYPVGMDLYPIEPLNGIVAFFLPWANIILLSNILVVINMTATGVAGAWFGRVLTNTPKTLNESEENSFLPVNRMGGWVAGILLEGSAVMAFFVHVGVGELHHLWWLPLGLGSLVMARRTFKWQWFFTLSFCLIGAMLSCFYLGFFLAMSTAVWALCTLWAGKETPKLLLKYFISAGIAVSVVLPVTQSFAASYKTGDVPSVGIVNYILQDHGQPVTDPPSARLELAHLYTPERKAETREESAYGGGRYLGSIAILLAIVGLIRRPKEALPWLVVAIIGVLFAFGTYLTEGGELIRVNGARLRMPILWLNRALGYVAEPLNFPVRFMAMTSVSIAGMAAYAIRDWRYLFLLPLAVIEIQWGQMLEYPWQTFVPRNSEVLTVLQDVDDKAVLDLGLAARSDMENRFNGLSTQMAHGKKVQSVPVERVEYFARDGQFFVQATQLFQDLKPLYENRGGALKPEYRKDLALLQDAGFGWIVVGYRSGRERMPSGIVDALTQLCGEPTARGMGLGAWKLPEVSYTQEELDAWKVEHETAILSLARMTPGMGPPPK